MGRGWGQNLILKIGDICVAFILAKKFLDKQKARPDPTCF